MVQGCCRSTTPPCGDQSVQLRVDFYSGIHPRTSTLGKFRRSTSPWRSGTISFRFELLRNFNIGFFFHVILSGEGESHICVSMRIYVGRRPFELSTRTNLPTKY